MRYTEIITEAKRMSTPDFVSAAIRELGPRVGPAVHWSEITALASRLGVSIPLAVRNARIVGRRGYVSLDAALGSVSKGTEAVPVPVTAPKAVAPTPVAKAPTLAPAVNLLNVATELFRKFKNHPMGRSLWMSNPPQEEDGKLMFDLRDWGHWAVPYDEEDDGDYDWKVPSDDTKAAIRSLCGDCMKEYPGIEVDYSVEEKNWLMVYVGTK